MVSSLLHVLIVTPVIFFSLRERQLKKRGAARASDTIEEESSNETTGRASDEDRPSVSGKEKESVIHE